VDWKRGLASVLLFLGAAATFLEGAALDLEDYMNTEGKGRIIRRKLNPMETRFK
jgi:hypothetical protein